MNSCPQAIFHCHYQGQVSAVVGSEKSYSSPRDAIQLQLNHSFGEFCNA